MSRKQLKRTLLMGAGCAVFLLAGIVYSLLYNDGRWVREMDLEEHVFSAKNIPMLAAGWLVALYAVYIAVVIYRESPQGPFHTKESSSELHPPGAALPRCVRNIRPFGPFRLLDMAMRTALSPHFFSLPCLGCSGCFLRESFHTLWRTSCFSRTRQGQT